MLHPYTDYIVMLKTHAESKAQTFAQTRKSSCEKPQEAYRLRHNLSRVSVSTPVQDTYLSPIQGRYLIPPSRVGTPSPRPRQEFHLPSRVGTPSPGGGQSENITFRHPSDAGGNENDSTIEIF